jgi:rhodanese-related sulfurtransferase
MKALSAYFRKAASLSADEVKQFMKELEPDEYNLIDVREPKEYESQHIPGAQLMPVGQIDERAHEINPGKPTLVY